MSELGRRLNEMTVRALSPDGKIRALIKGRGLPIVSFADPDDFSRYRDASTLANEVSAVLSRAAKGQKDGRKQILDKHSRLPQDGTPHWNSQVRQMYDELDSTMVEGRSGQNLVRVATAGLETWQVRIRPGALESMSVGQFCSEVNTAVRDAGQRYFSTMRRVKAKTLGSMSPI